MDAVHDSLPVGEIVGRHPHEGDVVASLGERPSGYGGFGGVWESGGEAGPQQHGERRDPVPPDSESRTPNLRAETIKPQRPGCGDLAHRGRIVYPPNRAPARAACCLVSRDAPGPLSPQSTQSHSQGTASQVAPEKLNRRTNSPVVDGRIVWIQGAWHTTPVGQKLICEKVAPEWMAPPALVGLRHAVCGTCSSPSGCLETVPCLHEEPQCDDRKRRVDLAIG